MQGCGKGCDAAAWRPGRRRGLRLVTALLLGCGVAASAAAQGLPPMVAPPSAGSQAPVEAVIPTLNLSQQGVPAEAAAENGVVARERALAAGRRLAWERLLAEAAAPAIPQSDSQIDNLVTSIVIEQERPSPTRYSGRITVNFSGPRVRSLLAGRAPSLAVLGGGGGAGGGDNAGLPAGPPAPTGAASNWLEAVASYRSMGEWLELRRRLRGAGPIATVEILGIAVDAARLRIGLRLPPEAAAADLAGLGIALQPAGQPYSPFPLGGPAAASPIQSWRLGLAGGG